MEAEILNLLNSTDGSSLILERIQVHLGPVISSKVSTSLLPDEFVKFGKFAVTILHSIVTNGLLDKLDNISNICSIIDLCAACYMKAKDHVKFKDSKTVPKLYYHIFSSLCKKSRVDETLAICKLLYVYMIDLDLNDLSSLENISKNVYAALWNLAIKNEAEEKQCPDNVLNIQTTSLEFLALCDANSTVWTGKATTLLMHYESLVNNSKESSNDECLDMCCTKFISVIEMWLRYDNVEADPTGISEFLIFLHRYFIRHNLMDKTVIVIKLFRRVWSSFVDPKNVNKIHNACFNIQEAVRSDCITVWIAVLSESLHTFETTDLTTNYKSLTESLLFIKKQLSSLWDIKDRKLALSPSESELLLSFLEILRKCLLCYHDELPKSKMGSASRSGNIKIHNCDILSSKMFIYLNLVQTDPDLIDCYIDKVIELFQSIDIEKCTSNGQECSVFGSIANSFGVYLYNKALFTLSAKFFEYGMGFLIRWCKADKKLFQQKVKQQKLWNWFHHWADSLRKLNRFVDAQHIVVKGLLIDASCMKSVAELWCKIKRDASPAIVDRSRTLKHGLQDTKMKYDHIDLQELLGYELQTYNKRADQTVLEQLATLDALLDTCHTESSKMADFKIQKGQCLWTSAETESSAVACFKDAIAILEVSETDDRLLALAKLWLFISYFSTSVNKMKIVPVPKPKKTMINDEDDDCEEDIFENLATLSSEYRRTAVLDVSLEHWEKHIRETNGTESDLKPLLSMRSLYALLLRPGEELRCCYLIHAVCQNNGTSGIHFVDNLSTMLLLMSDFGMLSYCDSLLTMLKQAADTLSDSEYHVKLQSEVATAYCYLLTGKVAESFELIQATNSARLKHCSSRSVEHLKIEALVCRFLSKLYTVPLHNYIPDVLMNWSTNIDGSLLFAYDSVRVSSAIMHHIIGSVDNGQMNVCNTDKKQSAKVNSLHQWDALNDVLDAFLHSGSVSALIGDYRAAKCYFQEGVKVAQTHCLPRRIAVFFLKLSELENVSSNFAGCELKLDQCYHVLNSSQLDDSMDTYEEKLSVDLFEESCDSSSDKKDNFPKTTLDSQENDDNNDDDDDFIKTKPLDANYLPEKNIHLNSSPKIKKMMVNKMSYMDHDVNCSCVRCNDIYLHYLNIQWYCVLGEYFRKQKQLSMAQKSVDAAFNLNNARKKQLCKSVFCHFKMVLSPIKSQTRKNGMDFEQLALPWKIRIASVHVLQAKLSSNNGDYKSIPKQVDTCSHMLSPDDDSQMITHTSMLAEVMWLNISMYIKRFQITIDTPLQRLVNRLQCLDLKSRLNVESCDDSQGNKKGMQSVLDADFCTPYPVKSSKSCTSHSFGFESPKTAATASSKEIRRLTRTLQTKNNNDNSSEARENLKITETKTVRTRMRALETKLFSTPESSRTVFTDDLIDSEIATSNVGDIAEHPVTPATRIRHRKPPTKVVRKSKSRVVSNVDLQTNKENYTRVSQNTSQTRVTRSTSTRKVDTIGHETPIVVRRTGRKKKGVLCPKENVHKNSTCECVADAKKTLRVKESMLAYNCEGCFNSTLTSSIAPDKDFNEKRSTRNHVVDDNSAEILRGGSDEMIETLLSRDGSDPTKYLSTLDHPRATNNQTQSNNDTVEGEEVDSDQLLRMLDSTFELLKHFPSSVLYRKICHSYALLYYDIHDYVSAAYYLSESMAVTFRHQVILNDEKKARKFCKYSEQAAVVPHLRMHQNEFNFKKTVADFSGICENLPSGWTVCQLSVVDVCGQDQLLISRLSSDDAPIVCKAEGYTEHGCDILDTFREIISQSRLHISVAELSRWWKIRSELDAKMKDLIRRMEDEMVSPWKCLLLGKPLDEENNDKLLSSVASLMKLSNKYKIHQPGFQHILKVLLNAAHLYCHEELCQVMSSRFPDVSRSVCQDIATAIKKSATKLNTASWKRQPLIMVLDRVLQSLPWDSVPMLIDQPVSRMLSIYAIHAQLKLIQSESNNVYDRGVNMENAYYILDPDNNLPSTVQLFLSLFKKQGWKGLCNTIPSTEDYKSELAANDLFLYCGHGSGSRYVHGEALQMMVCRVAAVIMGCSSGLLKANGDLEATGTIVHYILAGCPFTIGNLWDVTDKDIDRFLEKLLVSWIKAKPGTPMQEMMAKARAACKLPYLIGAAPTIYGLPLVVDRKVTSRH